MKGAYLATAGRIRQELAELDQVVARIQNIWNRRRQEPLPAEQDYWVDAVALNLHSYYAGMERILELIADSVDQAKPSGAMWHRDLLQQMTADLSGIRPAVLSTATRNGGFRHVVRNIYTFSLDAEQIEILVVHLSSLYPQAKTELETFAKFLEQSAQP